MNSGERTKLRCGKYRESEADSVQVVLGNRRFVPFLFSPRFGSGSICKPHFLEVPDPLVSFGINCPMPSRIPPYGSDREQLEAARRIVDQTRRETTELAEQIRMSKETIARSEKLLANLRARFPEWEETKPEYWPRLPACRTLPEPPAFRPGRSFPKAASSRQPPWPA